MMAQPRYALIAIDLDGTLLGPTGEVSGANRRAIERARRAGLHVTVCTGRGLAESAEALAAIEQRDPVIVAGGAMVACPSTRRTLERRSMPGALVAEAVEHFLAEAHPALVLKDPLESDLDYLVVSGREGFGLDESTKWWFRRMGLRVRTVETLDQDEHPEHTVRVGACGMETVFAGVHGRLRERFEGRAVVHSFGVPPVSAGGVGAGHAAGARPALAEGIRVLEVFDREVTKWWAVDRLARSRGIDAARVVAIGDELNDLPMIERAGLGVAMGNAAPAVLAAADRVTSSHAEDGVAHAIDRVLSGEW